MPEEVLVNAMALNSIATNATRMAAPISVAAGLRTHLFEKLSSVVMCSATLCTSSTGYQLVPRG